MNKDSIVFPISGRYWIVCLIAMLFVSCGSTKQKDLVLVKDGKTDYHIILPKQPTDNELYAAQTLQHYMYKISGAKIPIVYGCRKNHKREICIGYVSDKHEVCKQSNTVSVQRNGQTLVFSNKNDKYTMYSVIDFMEKYLGVRQFTSDCDYYPVDSNVVLKNFESYTYKSPNVYRNVHSQFLKKDKNLRNWLKTSQTEDMFANGFFVHTAKDLLSDKEYFDTHPEYFALVNGERVREQPCWSNKDVYLIMRENLRQAMLLQPDKQVWSVSQNDNDVYCQCLKCNASIKMHGSPAAPIIFFVNKLAKEFPQKTISTLAYQYSRKCPDRIEIEPNVQIMLCTIEADRNKTIAEQGNRPGSFAYDLNKWSKKTDNIFLWDYDVDFAYYMCPFPNLHVLQPNILFFVKSNAFSHFQQANCDAGHENSELKNYLLSQLLWNPYIDINKTIREFCDNYYGFMGYRMYMYIEDMEKLAMEYADSVGLDIYGSPVKYKDNILSEAALNTWAVLQKQYTELSSEDSIINLRIRKAFLPLDFAIMEIGKTEMYGRRGWFENKDGKWVVKDDMRNRLENFYQTCVEANVRDLNESGLTPYDYYVSTKRIIANDLSENFAFHKKVSSDIPPSELYSSGNLQTLTDGVQGSDDYKMLWLGWWAQDVEITVDLDTVVSNKDIKISSLHNPKSWILHPLSVECFVSVDNKNFKSIGLIDGDGYNRNNTITKDFVFYSTDKFRYVKFVVKGTKTLPAWHPSYTNKAWFFLDEITVCDNKE